MKNRVKNVRRNKLPERYAMLPILSIERPYMAGSATPYTMTNGQFFQPLVIRFADISPYHHLVLYLDRNGRPLSAHRQLTPDRLRKRKIKQKTWPLTDEIRDLLYASYVIREGMP